MIEEALFEIHHGELPTLKSRFLQTGF